MNKYLLALNGIESLKPSVIGKIERAFPDLSNFFQLKIKELRQIGFSQAQAKSISTFDFDTLDYTMSWPDNKTSFILDWHHPKYPNLLKHINEPPPILFAKGNLEYLNSPALAIIGSRKPSPYGIKNAQEFSQKLSQSLVIVSGLAQGIDGHAHRSCIKANGHTIAVVANGIDRVYPRIHHKLADMIIDNGLILSEFPLNTPPLPRQFPRRNRIISGLCLGTLIIEASIKSGSMLTANHAIEQNRDVFSIPGSINNPLARGCHYLIKQGAILVSNYEDILNELSINYQQLQKHQKKLGDRLATHHQKLVSCVGYELTTLEEIQTVSGLAIDTLLSQLVELELLGKIQAIPGGYMRC